MEGSPLLPEGTQLPDQNLEGVMRSLDMVERALQEAMLMAEEMPGPDESAIGEHQHQHQELLAPAAAGHTDSVLCHLVNA